VLCVHALSAARLPEPIPHGVHVVRVERIRGDGLLVVEEEGSHVRVTGVSHERHRVAPVIAAVGGLADLNGAPRLRRRADEGERKADEVCVAVRREGDPRIRGPLKVTAVRFGSARAYGEGRIRGAPSQAAVVRHRRSEPACSTEGVPVLLVDADDVGGVRGVHSDPRLQFAVDVVGLPGNQEPRNVARSERAVPIGRRAGCARNLVHDGGHVRARGRSGQRNENYQGRNQARRSKDASPHGAPPSIGTETADLPGAASTLSSRPRSRAARVCSSRFVPDGVVPCKDAEAAVV